MPTTDHMIAGVEVRIDGQAMAPEIMALVQEVRVDDHLNLPDTFVIALSDPGLEHIDRINLEVGKEVEILFAAPDGNRYESLLKGQITTVEPEFSRQGATITARGYDHSHQMNRERRAETYQNMTVGDIARRVASRAGISIGAIDDAGGPVDFMQQNNETDWEFLGRLARRIGNEALVAGRQLEFRTAGGPASPEKVTLRWGENLISFKPRITGVSQVEDVAVRGWDAVSRRVIEATARPEGLMSSIGVARDTIVSALNGGRLTVADAPVASQQEADALARSLASRVANSYLEADGICEGHPKVRAGCTVKIEGVGTRFGGEYTVSSTRHVFRGGRGYRTHFAISGQQERSLVELLTPARKKRWGNSVVIGIVTNNDDPEAMGRVRVKYPELGDTEGTWARVATPGAGADKGLLMLPKVDDEVVIGFEHDDIRRPYVLGCVFNGQAKPDDLASKDGSFMLKSPKDMGIDIKEKISIKGGDELVIEVGQSKVTCKKDGTIQIEGKDITLKANGSISVEAGPQGLKLSSQGQVQVSGAQIQLG
jgi:phage protein D